MKKKNQRCDACRKTFPHETIHNECDIHLCVECYGKKIIKPGQYYLALQLWYWNNFKKTNTTTLPDFWPMESNTPLSTLSILKIALQDDIERLPCGTQCSCEYISKKLQKKPNPATKECIFYRMDKADPAQSLALLLYWWHIYYATTTKNGNSFAPPISEFWPSKNGRPILPKKLVEQIIR